MTKELDEIMAAIGSVYDEVDALLDLKHDGEKVNAGHVFKAFFQLSGPFSNAFNGVENLRDELDAMTDEDVRRLGGNAASFIFRVVKDISDDEVKPLPE